MSSFEIFPGIARLSRSFSALLLDAYGVFWGGNDCGLLPGSKEVMESLVMQGKIIGIVSNSTQLAQKEINKLSVRGLVQGKHFHFLVTSGEVTREIFLKDRLPFQTPRKKFFLFGEGHPTFSSHEAIFQDTRYAETSNIDEADFVYISIPHINGNDQQNPELFREELEKLRVKNLPFVCPNPDLFAHEGNPPRAVVRQGSIAQMWEKEGGKVFYMGKPYKEIFSSAMSYLESYHIASLKEILMVGDTPETDIRGARSFGLPSALVTQTGIMADRIGQCGFRCAVGKLSGSDYPDYFIGRLIDDIRSSS